MQKSEKSAKNGRQGERLTRGKRLRDCRPQGVSRKHLLRLLLRNALCKIGEIEPAVCFFGQRALQTCLFRGELL